MVERPGAIRIMGPAFGADPEWLTARAKTEVRLLKLEQSQFLSLAHHDPIMTSKVLWSFLDGLKSAPGGAPPPPAPESSTGSDAAVEQ